MPDEKICPLFLIFYKTSNNTCIRSECQFWSTGAADCYFVIGMQSLSVIGFSIKELISELEEHRIK